MKAENVKPFMPSRHDLAYSRTRSGPHESGVVRRGDAVCRPRRSKNDLVPLSSLYSKPTLAMFLKCVLAPPFCPFCPSFTLRTAHTG